MKPCVRCRHRASAAPARTMARVGRYEGVCGLKAKDQPDFSKSSPLCSDAGRSQRPASITRCRSAELLSAAACEAFVIDQRRRFCVIVRSQLTHEPPAKILSAGGGHWWSKTYASGNF